MIRVVIDTNVVVSAIISDEGLPAAILDLAANRKIQTFVTEPILAEYERVFRYPHLQINPAEASAALALIRKTSKIVTPRRALSISRDAHDNYFYECAEAAKARYLITGNTKHFPHDHKFTKIVTPREFMAQIGLSLADTDLKDDRR